MRFSFSPPTSRPTSTGGSSTSTAGRRVGWRRVRQECSTRMNEVAMTDTKGASIEVRLARLETAEDVRTLEAEYAVAVDMNDVDRVLSLCAPDIVLRVGD